MPEIVNRLLHPKAGWLSIGLLMVMALSVSWSVQGAKWLDQLAFLAPVAVLAVLAGALLGMLRTSILITLPLGALIGTGVVLWAVGADYFPELGQVDRLLALRIEFIDWLRLILDTGYPPQMSPYAAGLGALMFATAFMAAHATYRDHRVLDAIVLLGAALIANMSATFTDLFGFLLLFVSAALLLWLRATLADRRDGWQRRRVSENVEVPEAIMRSGVIFAAGSVALAWILTSVAVAAPLTEAWRSLDGAWVGLRDQMDGVLGSLTNPQSRITGSSFGPSFTVEGEWVSVDDEALILRARRPFYLRTSTYDVYTGRGWSRSEGEKRSVAESELLFPEATSERPTIVDSVEVHRIEIEMLQSLGRNLFTAGSPLRIYGPSVVIEPQNAPLLGGIEHPEPASTGDIYQLQVAISVATEAELGTAGRAYPSEVEALYLGTPGLTDRVAELARVVTERAENDYQRVEALANYLKFDPSFSYATKGAVPGSNQDLVDFFLFSPEADRTGYCEYYASAMVMLTRSLGIPARVAVGFAPGERIEEGEFLSRESGAHAWAEVYFPGYGWQIFESTPSINSRFFRSTGVEGGPAGQPPAPGDDPLLDWDRFRESEQFAGTPTVPLPTPGAGSPDDPSATPAGDERSGNALIFAVLLLGVLVVVWLRMRHTQRQLRLLPAGDRAWRQLLAAAERAGVGQRPSETAYEYAGWLEEQLPAHREPIRAVADGKVWQSYSGRRLTLSASQRLETALARLRMPMLGLAVRHWLRRLTRRDSD